MTSAAILVLLAAGAALVARFLMVPDGETRRRTAGLTAAGPPSLEGVLQ